MSQQNNHPQELTVESENALQALKSLCNKIAATIEEGKKEGVLRPTEEIYTRYPIDPQSIKEGEFGLERVNYTTEEFAKASWFHAMRAVVWRLQESADWSAILTVLEATNLTNEEAKRLLDAFAHTISYMFLETDEADERSNFVNEKPQAVRAHLNHERFCHTTEVRLVGLVPPSNPIEFTCHNIDFGIRRLLREDLLEEQSSFFDRDRFPPTPSAILRLSKVVEYEHEVQKMVWQAITALRLIKVGSVRELSYTNESNSFFSSGGTHRSHQHFGRVTNAILGDEEVEHFKEFCIAIMSRLPPEGYGRNREHVDPTEISYNRYSDALLAWGMPVERRISDAVIGLESLFLSEMDELSYRLRLRVAKLLGVFSFDPLLVKSALGLAYEVRSCFLHGSHVSKRILTKIEKQHGGLDKLLLQVLDYLRCAISAVTLTTIHKAELINRLDTSFLDDDAWVELNELFHASRSLLRPSI